MNTLDNQGNFNFHSFFNRELFLKISEVSLKHIKNLLKKGNDESNPQSRDSTFDDEQSAPDKEQE